MYSVHKIEGGKIQVNVTRETNHNLIKKENVSILQPLN